MPGATTTDIRRLLDGRRGATPAPWLLEANRRQADRALDTGDPWPAVVALTASVDVFRQASPDDDDRRRICRCAELLAQRAAGSPDERDRTVAFLAVMHEIVADRWPGGPPITRQRVEALGRELALVCVDELFDDLTGAYNTILDAVGARPVNPLTVGAGDAAHALRDDDHVRTLCGMRVSDDWWVDWIGSFRVDCGRCARSTRTAATAPLAPDEVARSLRAPAEHAALTALNTHADRGYPGGWPALRDPVAAAIADTLTRRLSDLVATHRPLGRDALRAALVAFAEDPADPTALAALHPAT